MTEILPLDIYENIVTKKQCAIHCGGYMETSTIEAYYIDENEKIIDCFDPIEMNLKQFSKQFYKVKKHKNPND